MDFRKTHSIEIRLGIGPENILFAGVCMNFSAWKFYGLGQRMGLKLACGQNSPGSACWGSLQDEGSPLVGLGCSVIQL